MAQVDGAITDFGMAIGPLTMGDLADNDIGYLVRTSQKLTDPNQRQPANMRYSSLSDELVTRYNRVGQKAKKGWYDYTTTTTTTNNKNKKLIPQPSTQVSQLIQHHCLVKNAMVLPCSSTVQLHKEEIVERLLFPLVNEGFKVLQEAVARHPHDIDIIYIYGYGWPAWRGGPMYWADYQIGLPHILKKLQQWSQQCQDHNLDCPHLIPSPLLQQCISQNLTIHDYYNKHQPNKSNNNSKKPSSNCNSSTCTNHCAILETERFSYFHDKYAYISRQLKLR